MDYDSLLEKKLEEIEAGIPLDIVIGSLPQAEDRLREHIRLATQIRNGFHPPMEPRSIISQLRKVRESLPKKNPMFLWRWRWALAAAAAIGVFALLAIGALPQILGLGIPYATLSPNNGVVELRETGGDWMIITHDEQITAGSEIRTYADSSAEIHYPDRSVTKLEAGTTVRISQFAVNKNASIELLLEQSAGVTSHSVMPLSGLNSYFQVSTPHGLVSVHGTAFTVDILENDMALIEVDHGEVEVRNTNGLVKLKNGQQTRMKSDEAPSAPAYGFHFGGELTKNDAGISMIGNAPVILPAEDLNNLDQLVLGGMVQAKGHILPSGERIVDKIDPNGKSEDLRFIGTLDAIAGNTWLVSGSQLLVNEETKLDQLITARSVVKVTFRVLEDGTWLASKIRLIEEGDESQPLPTATVEPPGLTPEVDPDDLLTQTLTPSLTPRSNGVCGADAKQPEAERLAERYGVDYSVIMSRFCQQYGFGEIDLAYSLSLEFNIPVDQIFEMRESGMGWGTIKQALPDKSKPTKTPKPDKPKKPTKTPK